MSNTEFVLHIRIDQEGIVSHRYLNGRKDAFYFGKNPRNDLPLNGDVFPEKQPLFIQKRRHYYVCLPNFSNGKVQANKAELNFADLIEHDLLPQGRGFHKYELKPGRMGYLFLDKTRVDFTLEQKVEAPKPVVNRADMAIFSRRRALVQSLRDDALFKGIVTLLILINAFALYGLRDYIPLAKSDASANEISQRLIKLAFKAQPDKPKPVPKIEQAQAARNNDAGEKEPEQANKQPEASSSPKKKANPSTMGVLALLAGTGESKNVSGMQDILNTDLVATVGKAESGRMQVGKSGNDDSDTDNLLNSFATEGIDNFVGSLTGSPESVTLGKKVEVQVESLGSVSGSEEARGSRSDGSLYTVLRRHMARLQYIYGKYLKRNPNLGGILRVDVTILANGRVKSAVITSSNLGNQELEEEILARIRQFRYETIESGELTVEYPLLFSKKS